jgi:hypothetical protein
VQWASVVGIRIPERGVKSKRSRLSSYDTGEKSVSEKSKSTGGKCVIEWELHRWETWCDTDKSQPLRDVKK